MDEFLDHLFSSSSWSDVNPTERSSWVCSGSDQTNGLLPDLMGVYEGNENNSPTSLVPSNQIIESLDTQGTSSIFVGGDPNYGPGKSLLPGEAQPQKGTDHESKPSLNGVVNGSLKSGYSGLQLNTTTLTPAVLNLSSPKVLPVVGSLAKSPHAIPESDSVGSNGNELSGCQPSLGDSHSLPSIPQLWPPPSYGSVSSISPVRGQNKLQGFGVQEEFVDTDNNVLGNRYLGDDKFLQLENLPESLSGKDELHNNHLSSYVAGPPITLSRTAGLQSQVQMPQLNEGNSIKHYMNQAPVSQLQSVSAAAAGVCNGAVKPRVRARRGQATDPHSIAERLRREKIAERMKNLQELVPNSNKTDKASMLDEIIEYVKFLQLQVKVLSMSRLGAAGAVVPLITDGQAEGSSGVLLSSSNGQAADPSESLDSIAFEQEVAKLMESNVTMAMQYLQSKGLCLMPIALAAAISGGKPSSGPFFGERKKPSLTHGLVPQNNGSLGSGTRQMSSDGEIVTKENVMGNHNREGITTNGAFIKQEEVKNTLCPTGELKPKA